MLTIEHLDQYYGGSHILRDVTFDVKDREIVALLGRNGAGKSTLLKTVIGITPPSTGAIALGSETLSGRPPAVIARQGVSYVPQGRGLFAGMTVAQNLELGRLKRRNGMGIFWDEDRILEFFPRIGERWHSPPER